MRKSDPRMRASLLQAELDRRNWNSGDRAAAVDLGLGAVRRIGSNQAQNAAHSTHAALARALDPPLQNLVETCSFAVEKRPAMHNSNAYAPCAVVSEVQPGTEPLPELEPEQRPAVLA